MILDNKDFRVIFTLIKYLQTKRNYLNLHVNRKFIFILKLFTQGTIQSSSLTIRPFPVLDRVGRSADLPPIVPVLPCTILYPVLLHISRYDIPPPQFLSSSAPFPFHWRLICSPHPIFWFSSHYMP